MEILYYAIQIQDMTVRVPSDGELCLLIARNCDSQFPHNCSSKVVWMSIVFGASFEVSVY